jgi:hypothetical protein
VGKLSLPKAPFRFSEADVQVQGRAPLIGEDNERERNAKHANPHAILESVMVDLCEIPHQRNITKMIGRSL